MTLPLCTLMDSLLPSALRGGVGCRTINGAESRPGTTVTAP